MGTDVDLYLVGSSREGTEAAAILVALRWESIKRYHGE